MVKGTGFFSDMGNKAREIMSKGYDNGVNINVAGSNLSDANDLFYSGALTGNSFSSGMEARIKQINTNIALQVDKSAGMFATVVVDKVIPGLKTFFKLNPTRENPGEIEIRFQDKYAGITSSFDLKANPVVNFSGILCTKLCEASDSNLFDNHLLRFGADIAVDTATDNITKLNIGFQTSSDYFRACVVKNLMAGHATLSYYLDMSPQTSGCVEFFRFLDGPLLNGCAIGIEHELSPRIKIKARVDECGNTKAAMIQKWKPNSSITISGEFNPTQLNEAFDLTHAFKFGMSVDLMLE